MDVHALESAKIKLKDFNYDENFLLKLKNAKTIDEAVVAFKNNGINLSTDELISFLQSEQEKGELSEIDLENISGGASIIRLASFAIKCFFWNTMKVY